MSIYLAERIRNTLRDSSIALSTAILDIFAGYIVTYMLTLITATPHLLIIYPMLLTGRGNLGGVLTGNISTKLHLGTLKPTLKLDNLEFYSMFAAITLLSIYVGLYIGLIPIINIFTIETTIKDIMLIVSSALNTMVIATYLGTPLTAYIVFKSFQYGLDPDIIGYPVKSTILDIFVGLTFTLTSIGMYLLVSTYPMLLIPATLTILFPALILTLKYGLSEDSKNMIRESIPLITILIFVSWGTGNILSTLHDVIVRLPVILVIFPAFATLMGDMGSIIGSMTTTRLYLGEIKPRIVDILKLAPEILAIELVSILVLIIATALSAILTFTPIPILTTIFFKILVAQLIMATVLIFLPTFIAFITFKRGLNADNFVIPVETTFMDLLTTLILSIVLIIT